MGNAAALEVLRTEIRTRRIELAALEHALSILETSTTVTHSPVQVRREEPIVARHRHRGRPGRNTIPSLIEKVLREAGKPMTTNQLISLLVAHGKHVTPAVMRSCLYLYVKKRKIVRRMAPGLFGLLEWDRER